MTQPVKVLGFLDVTGQFDASLMLVMVGAIGVHFVGYRIANRLGAPVFDLPARSQIDAKLIGGAVIFGAGWGLGGYCPGPGVVSLVGGGYSALTFVSAMLIGIFATAKLQTRTPTNEQSGEAVGGDTGIKVANLSTHEHSITNQ
jgi:uncharacterized membrane protein YedE/YeeE